MSDHKGPAFCFFLLVDFQVIKTQEYLYVVQIQTVSKWKGMFIFKTLRLCARTFSKNIQTYGYQWGGGMREGWTGSLGLGDANYDI